MTAANPSHEHAHDSHALSPALQLKANRLGLWLFFVSEIFLFLGLFAGRFYLWRDESGATIRPDLDQNLALVTTAVLLLSSFFMVRAETAMAHGDRKTFSSNMLITFFLGLGFLLGVVLFEWGVLDILAGREPHLRMTDGAFGAMFFGMTGMHALHVLTGLILILVVRRNGNKGDFSAESHWGVEACALYWHYVDLVWVFFYPALYLVGKVVEVHHG